ncbi:DUF3888 domain-containing protein [Bacillaceae bacterium S4-13-56]
MRKKHVLVISVMLFFFLMQPYKIQAAQNSLDNKLLNDTLLTALSPHISKEIINYYGYMKQYGLYDVEILSINRESEGGFGFEVKVLVETFEHAHNPPYGKETITFQVTPSGIETINFIHQGDKEEKIVEKFYQDAITDIKNSFNLDLNTYEQYTYDQLFYKAEVQKDYKPLLDIVENIIVNILNPETKAPYKNVIDPVTYIKDNKGFILFKRADGTNVVYTVEKKDGKWQVIDKKTKQGKQMKKELIWYM